HYLEEMVMDDVAQASRALIEGAPPFHSKGFCKRDLHTVDVIAVPDRLQKGVGEPEVQDVHDRFLAQEVIDTVDGFFGEDCACNPIEMLCRSQIAAERLLQDHAAAFC